MQVTKNNTPMTVIQNKRKLIKKKNIIPAPCILSLITKTITVIKQHPGKLQLSNINNRHAHNRTNSCYFL